MSLQEPKVPSASRALCLQALAEQPLDVLVIGGGIVGAGVARDAAMRGLRVGLVEQHDFAFGTSSRSSRLLHGGLRYLAQGRLGLVHQASVEKKLIQKIAPHLAEPLPFIFPTYADNPYWKLWQLKVGVKLYDLLCSGRNFAASCWMNRGELLTKVPDLEKAGLQGAVRYYDGFTNDARLTLDSLRSANRHGALILNYCRFVGAERKELWEAAVEALPENQPFIIRARSVVNATGPWAASLPHSRVKLRLTKGIHLVVEQSKLPVPEVVVMAEGKRILFSIPWGERTILGTTDTDYEGPLEEVRADTASVDYVLRVTNRFFPQAQLGAQDVVSTWAGLRPLLASEAGTPSDISRSHQIRSFEPGWWDVAGGKLTTYRLMAQEVVDCITASLPEARKGNRGLECRTAREPLLPPELTGGVSGILPPECGPQVVEHYCRNEWAMHLEDVMLRRTGWHYYFRERMDLAQHVAGWMASCLAWSAARKESELRSYASDTVSV